VGPGKEPVDGCGAYVEAITDSHIRAARRLAQVCSVKALSSGLAGPTNSASRAVSPMVFREFLHNQVDFLIRARAFSKTARAEVRAFPPGLPPPFVPLIFVLAQRAWPHRFLYPSTATRTAKSDQTPLMIHLGVHP